MGRVLEVSELGEFRREVVVTIVDPALIDSRSLTDEQAIARVQCVERGEIVSLGRREQRLDGAAHVGRFVRLVRVATLRSRDGRMCGADDDQREGGEKFGSTDPADS